MRRPRSGSVRPGGGGVCRYVVGASLLAGLLTGCGGPGAVDVVPPTLSAAAHEECDALAGRLPETVADQEQREVAPDDPATAAWGDPAIVMRCGVPRPAGLRPDSECFMVNDVGWFAAEGTGRVVFTTIGRSTYVEVSVPDEYSPQANALPALAGPVQAATRELAPCV